MDVNCRHKLLGGEVMKQVKAQVMCRDDSTGGWVPVSGGGLSTVALRRTDDTGGTSYKITGHRQADDSVVLDCTLSVDLEYVAANPTFHHWQTGNKRYGLTFQTSADGRSFERNVHIAAHHMNKQYISASRNRPATTEEDIFMMLHFEKEPSCQKDSGRNSPRSRLSWNGRVPVCQCPGCANRTRPPHPRHLSLMEDSLRMENGANQKLGLVEEALKSADGKTFPESSYVRFAKSEADLSPVAVSHEYCYPAVDSGDISNAARPDVGPSRLPLSGRNLPAVGARRTRPRRVQCVYCCELFDPSLSRRQKCRDAPDRVQDYIDVASCACLADTVAYHYFADSEGEYEPACTCTRPAPRCLLKWTAMAALSLFVPCLCCFWPLVGCRRCAGLCSYCVPHHRAE